jgi:hypothetical protein
MMATPVVEMSIPVVEMPMLLMLWLGLERCVRIGKLL